MELTIIGEAVNWTSRYCDGAAGGEILISRALHQHLWRHVDAEFTTIQTKHEGPSQRLPAQRTQEALCRAKSGGATARIRRRRR